MFGNPASVAKLKLFDTKYAMRDAMFGLAVAVAVSIGTAIAALVLVLLGMATGVTP
jgi:hypothetical protein